MTAPLITRLEEAAEGSRELDAAIWRWTGGWRGVDHPPAYTTSLDAALALAERVLPGWSFLMAIAPIRSSSTWARTTATPCAPLGKHQAVWTEQAAAPTPALALCLAILKANHKDKP